MLHTRICDLFGIELPIVSAGMGAVARARLAAAVSEAGGLGTIALAGLSPEAVANEIARARALTSKPFAVNLLIPFMRPGVLELLAREKVCAVTLFWGDPTEQIPPAKKLGLTVIWQCGSAEEAASAKAAGANAIIAQGFEAGGHVCGTTSTLALIPAVRDTIGDLPMLAAGGIADGRGLVSALALGADGAVFGTRFVASHESAAHQQYKRCLLSAKASDTLHTQLFDIGWPGASHRVLRTPFVDRWETAGRPASGNRPEEGKAVARLVRDGIDVPLPSYSVSPPTEDTEGDIGGLAWYAGESVSMISEIASAGEIVRQIAAQAGEIIAKRQRPLRS